ncbi:hypothetical protein [Moraxella lacunata]
MRECGHDNLLLTFGVGGVFIWANKLPLQFYLKYIYLKLKTYL